MAPSPLAGTYKRYETGTQKLLKWLYESVPTAPHSVILKTPTEPSVLTAGRAPNASRKKPTKLSEQSPKKVPVDRLIILAQRIVDADPKIEIPSDILAATKDTIEGRKACAQWYLGYSGGQHSPADLMVSNSRYQHFLRQLEMVYEVLRKEVQSRRPRHESKAEISGPADLTNIYQHLELEEPSGETSNTEFGSTDPPRSKPSVVREFEYQLAEGDEGNGAFALFCLFEDLWEVRLQIRQLWRDYHAGKISFIAACHTTENAIRICFLLADEFHRINSDLQDFERIVDYLGCESCVSTARNRGCDHLESRCDDRDIVVASRRRSSS